METKIFLFALSTCVWCKKTKKLLDELGVKYDYADVDMLSGEERKNTLNELEKWNPRGSFPTLIINDKAILGYDEKRIREELQNG